MTARTRQTTRSRGKAKKARRKEKKVMQSDPLLKEAAEANERILNPNERERVIPSKPC